MIKPILSWILFLSIFALQAQTAKEIIDKNIAVTGGYNNWNQLNSIQLEGEVVIGVGNSYKIRIYHQRPHFKKVVFIENGKEFLNEGFDGTKAWTYDPISKTNILKKNYTPDAFETDLLNYERKGFKAEYMGKESIKGKECLKVKLIKNNNITTYYFDSKTYLLHFEENKDETIFYDQYKKVGDLSFAFHYVARPIGGENEYQVRFSEIKTNPYFEKKVFRF